jgi:hypothetical protein
MVDQLLQDQQIHGTCPLHSLTSHEHFLDMILAHSQNSIFSFLSTTDQRCVTGPTVPCLIRKSLHTCIA